MKKLVSIVLSLAILLSCVGVFASSGEKITVTLNGEALAFDVEPVIENDRVMVPFRAIFEALGCNVTYNVQEGRQFVTAIRGENQLIFQIGAYDMWVNGNAEALDVPPVIKQGRTLVPVRALSEAFGAEVEWVDETKTVAITSKEGQHKIKTVTAQKDLKDENGKILIYISYAYPVIENAEESSYIAQINDEYKAFAEKFVQEAESFGEDAELLREEMGEDNYHPMEFILSYDVHADRKNILSVTNYMFYYTGGAHPNSARVSRTFDMANEKELALSDVVNGDESERRTMIYDVFVNYMAEIYEGFSAETAKVIDEEIENVKFYLTDNGLVLYFDVYSIGPYAMGYPTVELEYTEGVFKIDWSKE